MFGVIHGRLWIVGAQNLVRAAMAVLASAAAHAGLARHGVGAAR